MIEQVETAGLLSATAVIVGLLRALHLAHHDPLTGLPTRRLWTRRAARALRRPRGLMLVICDGDHIKAANDSRGHQAGDALIRALASRLRTWAGPGGAVGRLGGDEFVACVRLDHRRAPEAMLEDLRAALVRPVPYDAAALDAGASIGAVLLDAMPDPVLSRALAAADRAMYQVKRSGRSNWNLDDPAGRESLLPPTPRWDRPGATTHVYITHR